MEDIRILLIADNPDHVETVKLCLTRAGFGMRLTRAENIGEGVELLKKEKFDLVLLGPGLPDCSETETLNNLRLQVPTVPASVLTGINSTETKLAAIPEGAEDYPAEDNPDSSALGRSINYSIARWKGAESLREGEKKYRLLFEAMTEGVALHEVIYDENHKPVDYVITDVNPAFESITGLKKKEAIGQKASVLYKTGKPPFLDLYARTAETGQPGNVEANFALTNRHFNISVISSERGRFTTVFSDITERKKYEHALQENEQHFRTLVKKSPVPLALYDSKWKFELLNDRFTEVFGYTIEDIPDINSWWQKAYPDRQYREEVVSGWKMAQGKGWPGRGENESPQFHIRCKDGSDRVVDISRTILGDKFLISLNDVTQLKRYEKDLQNGISQLHLALRGVIDATAKMVEMRDPYTGGHQERVAQLSMAIAREMGMSDERVMYIGMAAMAHDIGKINIPAEILTRTGTLSDLEYKFMKTHVKGSYDILKNIKFPWPVAEIVLQHHERLDGSGYPGGLRGPEILLEARIIGVADTVEAMTTDRPYRASPGTGEALEEISRYKGKLYDSRVVEACVNLFLEKGFRFDEEKPLIRPAGHSRLSNSLEVHSQLTLPH